MWFLNPKNDRRVAARRFIDANNRRLVESTAAVRAAHDVAWTRLVRACGGDVDLALAEAAAVLNERVLS
jgi:hypothetical protein